MDIATRRIVQRRADHGCEYCRIHEDDEPYTFHLEHIIPNKHGGNDEDGNLAWSCQNCNLGKGSNLSDFVDGKVVPIFDPRRQQWSRHFRWVGAELVGKTRCGKATVEVLNINHEDRVRLRKLLI